MARRRWMFGLGFVASLATTSAALADPDGGEASDAKVDARLDEAQAYGGSSFHLADPIAALGASAVPRLAEVAADAQAPLPRRVLAAQALGRVAAPAALEALRSALARAELPDALREVVEASCYLQGDRGPVDVRIAGLATKHRDLPIAASGAALKIARIHAATGRFTIAAGLMKDLVRRAAGTPRVAALAYDWACAAALSGDKSQALDAVEVALQSDRMDLDWIEKDLDLKAIRAEPRFVAALEKARTGRAGQRSRDSDLAGEPDHETFLALRKGWHEAFERWFAGTQRYWGGYETWLAARGKTADVEAAKAYEAEKGAGPVDPADEWRPKFVAFVDAHPRTRLAQEARSHVLAMLANQRKAKELVETYLAGLAEGPDAGPILDHVETVLTAAVREQRIDELRAALTTEVAARPTAPDSAQILHALAEYADVRGSDAQRAAHADVVRRFPGSPWAKSSQRALYELDSLQVGSAAPAFTAMDVHGVAWSLSALRGKVVLLDFWATWCGPCLGEIPAMQALAKEHARDGDFVILGISLDEDGWALADFLETKPMPWAHVCDLLGFDGPIATRYAVNGIPATVLVDREGKIAERDLRGDALAVAVRKLLALPK